MDAKKQCKGVLGNDGVLAIPKSSVWIHSKRLPRLVGANMTGYWDDGTEMKGI